MEDIKGHEKIDRLPILISQRSGVQLLGVPKIDSGTGESMAAAAFKLLKDWAATNGVVAMCFDTTSSNTGRLKGACVLLEIKLQRTLLWLACRHHVYEIFLRSAYEAYFPGTKAPTVAIFRAFKSQWNELDKTKFEPGIRDKKIKSILTDEVRQELVDFCKKELKKKIFRDDYKELLQLVLIFLGEDTGIIRFRAPGPDHHARWMSKAIYSLKIFLFSSQLELSKIEKEGFRNFSLFVVLLYTKAWFKCAYPLEAPKNDLEFFKSIIKYKAIDKKIHSAVMKKIPGHLWYLSPESIALSLFADNVSLQEKRLMRLTLLSQPPSDESTYISRLVIRKNRVNALEEKHLHDFITENTICFFDRFNISRSFLDKDPSEWPRDEAYTNAKAQLSTLEVVNDNAERSVKLMEDFNKKTKDEDMMQFLLLTVAEYRKKFQGYSKSELSLPE